MTRWRAADIAPMIFLLASPAEAFTSICVDDGSTGFSWRHGKWEQMNFFTEQHIVKRIAEDDPLASMCIANMATQNRSGNRLDGKRSSGCYAIYDVGTEPIMFDVTLCWETWGDKAITQVNCSEGGLVRYTLEPSGEFIATRTYSAPDSAAPAQRDSLVLMVGRCSVIAR